jgi:predicted dehydrogenase
MYSREKRGEGQRIGILLCGLGWWGLNWLKNIQSNRNYRLVGIVDADPARLQVAQRQFGMSQSLCFGDVSEAIRAVHPDAVAVVVSPDRHGEIIRAAVKSGVHILSEKPFAKDLQEAKDFLRLHNRHRNLQFIINQNYRSRDCIALLRKLILNGKIGEVGFFIYSHQQTVRIPGYRLEMPSPVLDDMSIHHFDLMRYLTNRDFEEIYAQEDTVNWTWFRGKPVFYAKVTMTGNVSGIYCGSWASEGKIGSWNGNIQIFGSKGCLELTDDGTVLFYKKHKVDDSLLGTCISGQQITPAKAKYAELQYTLQSFKRALHDGVRADTDVEDNIKSFAAVVAAKQSISSRSPVRIESLGLASLLHQ